LARSSPRIDPRIDPRINPGTGLTYRPIPAPDREVRALFGFVGAWAPPDAAVDSGWGAWAGDRLVGAVLLEKSGSAGMLHGPVVVAPGREAPPPLPAESDAEPAPARRGRRRAADAPAAATPDPADALLAADAEVAAAAEAIDVAARLLADALEDAGTRGIDTVFTRPQGLDPVWVRLGFIPVPEVELPRGLRGRPGVGLFAWRGGSALWSSAGRNAVPAGSRSRR
jgi:hypothetical protein